LIAAVNALDPVRVINQALAALNSGAAPLPLADVEKALAGAPNDARLWHVKGLILRARDQRELAIPALSEALRLAPAEPLIAHGYARTLLEAGLPAVEEFGRALKLAPGNPEVVRGLVAALAAQGRVAEAVEGLEIALRRSPLWTEGHSLLSSMRWAEGERLGFTRSFDEALSQHPTSYELRRAQLSALIEAEHFEDALARIRQATELAADKMLFATQEAAVFAEQGDVANAERLFAQLAPLKLVSADVWHVRHLLRTGRPDAAAKTIDRWLDTPEQVSFWHYAATAWRLAGDSRSDWLEGDERLVGSYDIADRLPPLDQLATVLRRLHTSKSEFFSQSVRGGTQTDGNLFQRIEPEIVAVREAVRSAVTDHIAQLPPIDPAHPLLRSRPQAIHFAGAWSVRLASGGRHANHVHPLGWLSSALYIVLPPDLGQDDAGILTLGEPQAELGLSLPPHRLIEPKPGRLALFPSWMWHGTRPFAEGERITVAFDVAPV